jgi:RNA polymerase sigma-70 factor (ECF subfamily)
MKYTVITSAIAQATVRRISAKRAEEVAVMDADFLIVTAVREGDTEGFGKLVRKYEDFILTLAMGLVKSEEAAKDVAQETFLRAYRAIRRFQLKSSFKTWLYRIAFNTAMSHLKRENTSSQANCDADAEPTIDFRRPQSLRLTFEKLIKYLKPDLKAVILFHYYDDLKYEDIAEIMNCPIGTVKIRLYRAKYELRKLWERYAV